MKKSLIVDAKLRSEAEEDISKWLNISTSSVTIIWKLYKKSGTILPKKYPGRKSSITEEKSKEIQDFLDESSINLAYTRLYWRAKKNERVNQEVIDIRFKMQFILSTV
jgi:transposase